MSTPLSVLLVEDSENDALLIIRALQRSGYAPVHQRVATEAALRHELRQPSWDIILADYSLPGFSGLAALTLAQQLRPDLPFILVSGAVGEDTAVAAMKAGAHDFLLKGSLTRLGPAVEREVREAEMRRSWRRAEQELRHREARFRSIIENVSDLILILDARGTIRYQSPSVGRVLGRAPDELAGDSIYRHLHSDDVSKVRDALAGPTGGQDDPPVMEYRVRRRDGALRILEGVATDLLHDPAIEGIVCHLRDVTERRRLEAERMRAQRLESLGSLTSGIAHDLNNLLTPIMIASDIFAEELAGSEYGELLEGLQVSTTRAADVVQHLLWFARGMEGGRERVDPTEIVRDLERMLRFSLPKAIEKRVNVPPRIWPVCGDAVQLLQVLINLSVNARDAMLHGGRLTVDAENATLRGHDLRDYPDVEPGPFVHFRVSDTGGGIPPEIRDRIFEPFFTTKEGEKGTGLGLSTSLNIVREHGGLMKVYSEIDRGTRFSVYVPAAIGREAAAAVQPEPDLPRGDGELVLIADDEVTIRNMVKEALAAYGYQTVTAVDGSEALAMEMQHRGRIALALIDMIMPLMDGPETARRLRRIDPSIRIVMQGGFVRNGSSEFSRDEVDGVLEKPYTTEQLLRSVAAALQKSIS